MISPGKDCDFSCKACFIFQIPLQWVVIALSIAYDFSCNCVCVLLQRFVISLVQLVISLGKDCDFLAKLMIYLAISLAMDL